MTPPAPLRLRDYSLTHRATGLRALNRRELRDRVRDAPAESLFLHFWRRLLAPGWTAGEYGNDLAEWAHRDLHDHVLAERLALVDPRLHPDVEALRDRVVEVVETRIEEAPPTAEATPERAFHFLVTHVVLYPTEHVLRRPDDLPEILEALSPTTLLHHFVEAPGSPVHAGGELRSWLRSFDGGGSALAERMEGLDLFLHDETGLREQLADMVRGTLGGGPAPGNGRGGARRNGDGGGGPAGEGGP